MFGVQLFALLPFSLTSLLQLSLPLSLSLSLSLVQIREHQRSLLKVVSLKIIIFLRTQHCRMSVELLARLC